MPEIPPEIVKLFIYHLGGMEQRQTHLKNCCLVSHTWRSIAQPLLFSVINLRPHSEATESFARIVTQFPKLIGYVDFFGISGRICDPCEAAIDVAHIVATRNPRALEVGWTIHEISRRARLYPSYLAVLPGLLASTRLTFLHLHRIRDFPATLFRHCAVLKELVLESCSFSQMGQPASPPLIAMTRQKLHSLTLRAGRFSVDETCILEWFTQPYCTLDLSELKMFVNSSMPFNDASPVICQFIRTFGQSFEAISIDPVHVYLARRPATRSIPFPVEQLRKLESLTILMLLAVSSRTHLLSWTVNLLYNLPEPNHLTRLVFDCLFYSPGGTRRDVEIGEWEEIDKILCLPAFANLKSLVIICDNEKDDVLYERLKVNLLSLLPRCIADPRKVVSIERRTRLQYFLDV
ncbi:hypothetical protein BDN72DRAFT_839463 [Pluteus cervinus]|uniref:Uncharacterized protein n=1 Tax=Pluteus cervinus TaxID=181527 RepID=A0ACD3AX02_9AGAR|nr:hypothetical protein BDN72DRAFT_839463 [Pluteus cervinus]